MNTKKQTKKAVNKAVKKSSKKSADKKAVSKAAAVAAPVTATGEFEFDTPERLKKLADFVQVIVRDNLESNYVDYIGALVEIKHALHELAAYKETEAGK